MFATPTTLPSHRSRFTEGQLKTFHDRYALRDADVNLLEKSPTEMWNRISKWAAAKEEDTQWAGKFYEILEDFRFVPGGRILHAGGSQAKVTASNCYVIPSPEDSRSGIMKSLGQWVEIQARGGGVGINMSSLRPSGEIVRGVHGTSSGPIPWMKLFTTSTNEVIQQGGSRRGAAMIMLDDSHPDIMNFITAKQTPGVLEGANLSVVLSDALMQAVKDDAPWDLIWGRKLYSTIKARELWDTICEAAWKSGEPGCFWRDRYNDQRNIWYRADQYAECTNPCGEQPLPPWGVCLLGTINAYAFVDGDNYRWDDLKLTVWRAVRFLDNVIDLCYYPIKEFETHQQNVRRMGLGVTGLADMLIAREITYGSAEGIEETEKLYRTINEEAWRESIRLGKEKGAFPLCDPKKHARSWMAQKLDEDIRDKVARYGIRNGYLTSQQPSGTGSLLAGVNSGIEPVHGFDTIRHDRIGVRKAESHAITMFEEATRNGGAGSHFVTANDLTPEQHVDMQAAAQKWNDSAISKTVNAPNDYTLEQVKELYIYAYDKGLRTIAFYRDGSRTVQVLYHGEEASKTKVSRPERIKLPPERNSITHRFRVGDQEGYLTVGLYEDGRPGELFITISKEGSTIRGLMDAFATSISIALQYGVGLEYLVGKYSGSQFEPSGMTENPMIPTASSIFDYIFRWLSIKFCEGDKTSTLIKNGHLCPGCGSSLIYEEGCERCATCDYNRCG